MRLRFVKRVARVSAETALMGLFAVYILAPLVWDLLSTTKSGQELVNTSPFSFPHHFRLWENVRGLFSADGHIFGIWLANSAGYSVVISTASTYCSCLAGFAMAKLEFVGRRVLVAVVIGSLMLPPTVLVIPLFILEARLHITNSYEGVILPQLFSAFGVFFMMVYLRESLPDAVLDAARMDGASRFGLFHRIVLPMAMPGLVTLFLVSFVAAWNNYFLPLVLLSSKRLLPVTVGLAVHLASSTNTVTGIAISIIPTMILFPVLQRYVGRSVIFDAVVE